MLGARLRHAGHDVHLLGRQTLQDAVGQDGLHVTGHTELHVDVAVHTEAPELEFDVVFVTCKAHDTATLAQQIAPCVGRAVVSLQNGLGNSAILAAACGEEKVVVASTNHGVLVQSPGHIVHAGFGTVQVGGAPDARGPVDLVAGLFEEAGLEPTVEADMTGRLWLKGAVNAGLNPTCALLGVPNGQIGERLEDARKLVREVHSLSRAAGVRLPADPVEVFDATIAATAENRCSMLQDVDAKRPTEIEQITGYFMRVSRRLGYPLFANEQVHAAIKALEETYLGDAAWATTRAAAEAFRWP